ncbi:MAG TPA: molybdenum cofactor biosynthesis protein MoaE [Acidobacteriaceae bacterium]|jgi:molybdopterin synthase catalytic subunit|nr:molybdenum cofactor biosynthesis protein MoaE [Acidobacteriaceae bacterium]
MRITLLAFGMLRELLGNAAAPLDVPAGATVRDVLERCRALAPEKEGLWSAVAVAVNEEYVRAGHRLAEGDEVALLPPVSGGADVDPGGAPYVRIVHERIVAQEIIPALERAEDGAVTIFDGIVRNHSRGRRTLYLKYEAYEAMALKKMEELAAEAKVRYPVRNVALVHRLGRLEIGESSVLVAVFSAHRGAAFDACRWLIDTLKQTVPIWKKEFFEDGAVWGQGDPFPAELKPDASGGGH